MSRKLSSPFGVLSLGEWHDPMSKRLVLPVILMVVTLSAGCAKETSDAPPATPGPSADARHAPDGEITVTPGLWAFQRAVVGLVAGRWRESALPLGNDPAAMLAGVHIHTIQSVDHLIPDESVSLVYAVGKASWWKQPAQMILIVRPEGKGYEPLLVWGVGYNGRGIDYEIVDLGVEERSIAIKLT